jgi:uncharacterized repeat protein (TIGR03803 family)
MSTPVATPIQTSRAARVGEIRVGEIRTRETIDRLSEPGSFALTPKSRTTHGPAHATGRTVATLCVLLLAFYLTSSAASEKVLYAFHGKDGLGPLSVMLGSDGSLYGTTYEGGTNTCSFSASGCGVVFQLTRGADGEWKETVLHDFAGSDGWFPNGTLVADKAGNLYGTTVYGGLCSQLGCGVIFELVRGNGNNWTLQVLHYFNVSDGANPYAGLIFDSRGNLYGTTSGGGNNACEGGCGLVFELSPEGKGKWTEIVLYSFDATDGSDPGAALTFDSSGNLYGTTEHGGAHGSGTVFKLAPGGQGWTETVLHSFYIDTKDGYEPTYGVTFDSMGNLYGTTQFGGTEGEQGWGTAFKLTPAGGRWKETILHSFDRAKFGGGYVTSGLALDNQGNLYGTATWGGRYDCPSGDGFGCGTAFKLTQADGHWSESVLHSFGKGNDGAGPYGGMARSSTGLLFGVTSVGGYTGEVPCLEDGCGVVFEITP